MANFDDLDRQVDRLVERQMAETALAVIAVNNRSQRVVAGMYALLAGMFGDLDPETQSKVRAQHVYFLRAVEATGRTPEELIAPDERMAYAAVYGVAPEEQIRLRVAPETIAKPEPTPEAA